MTTIVRTRNPLEALSMSQQPQSRRRSKRLAAFDEPETDGDFSFARVSKKTKTAPTEPEPPTLTTQAALPDRKRSKQKPEREHEVPTEPKKASRRKMSFNTPKPEKEEIKVAKRGVSKSTRSSIGKGQNGESSMNGTGVATDYDSVDMIGALVAEEASRSTVEVSNEQSAMIQLPFSDTPVMNRNKEFRKKGAGARRSSLGMRGRRASSLIDNGHSAIPHREVATHDFYKHIESDLSEPRRMKQLLTWTGERALGKKPSHGDPDNGAHLAARVIKEELLKDFTNRSEFSNWFDREESAAPPAKVIKTPNPRNIEHAQKIAELEPRIKRLQEERDQWKALAKPPPLPPLFEPSSGPLTSAQIDTTLLDPEQAAILSGLGTSAFETRKRTAERVQSVQSDLEFKVDQFADGVHKVEQYQSTARRVADMILALSAVRLEERDRREKEEVGTRDVPMQEVLRSLSRILPEGSNGR